MKYRLASLVVLLMSFGISQVSVAGVVDATVLSLFKFWMSNIDVDELNELVSEGVSSDEIFENVLLHSTPENEDVNAVRENGLSFNPKNRGKRCYFFGRFPCWSDWNCPYLHDSTFNRQTVQRLRNEKNKARRERLKKEEEAIEIQLKNDVTHEEEAEPAGTSVACDGGSNIEIFVTENGQLLEPKIQQKPRCYDNQKWTNSQYCKKKLQRKQQHQPPVFYPPTVFAPYPAQIPSVKAVMMPNGLIYFVQHPYLYDGQSVFQ